MYVLNLFRFTTRQTTKIARYVGSYDISCFSTFLLHFITTQEAPCLVPSLVCLVDVFLVQ